MIRLKSVLFSLRRFEQLPHSITLNKITTEWFGQVKVFCETGFLLSCVFPYSRKLRLAKLTWAGQTRGAGRKWEEKHWSDKSITGLFLKRKVFVLNKQ